VGLADRAVVVELLDPVPAVGVERDADLVGLVAAAVASSSSLLET
jgi:hypothetical protein